MSKGKRYLSIEVDGYGDFTFYASCSIRSLSRSQMNELRLMTLAGLHAMEYEWEQSDHCKCLNSGINQCAQDLQTKKS